MTYKQFKIIGLEENATLEQINHVWSDRPVGDLDEAELRRTWKAMLAQYGTGIRLHRRSE